MDRKWRIGTKILGIVFIVAAAYLINLPISSLEVYSPPVNAMLEEYRHYQMTITEMEEFQRVHTNSPKANQIKFTEQLTQLKQEAETFRQNYVVRHRIPLYAQLDMGLGFLTCVVFLITGLGLIMHFIWARRLALWSILSVFLCYLAMVFDIYSIVNKANIMSIKIVALESLLEPSQQDQLKFLLVNNFKVLTLPMLMMALPFALFSICVVFYLTRPKVKEQFK